MTAVLPADVLLTYDAPKTFRMFGLGCEFCGHAMRDWVIWENKAIARHEAQGLIPCPVGSRG